jgi:hypothetical protein
LHHLFCFCKIVLENLFKVFLQIVRGIWIELQEAFSRFEIFSPYFKCFSFDLNKTPLNEILLLVFKRVLDTNFESGHTNLKYIKNRIPIENFFKILKLVVVRSFCFGLILSPPLSWIAKNGYFVSEIWALITFSPMVQMNMSKDYTNSGEWFGVTVKGK